MSGVEWMLRMNKQSRVNVETERAEIMWTISEEDNVFTCIWKKTFLNYTLMSFCFVLMIM